MFPFLNLFMNLPFMGNIPRLLVIEIDGKEEFEVEEILDL
jgi:hypothetical protein